MNEPQIVTTGMMRRKIADDDIREKDTTPVDDPIQNVHTTLIPTTKSINPIK